MLNLVCAGTGLVAHASRTLQIQEIFLPVFVQEEYFKIQVVMMQASDSDSVREHIHTKFSTHTASQFLNLL
jgi:hypothetical protein